MEGQIPGQTVAPNGAVPAGPTPPLSPTPVPVAPPPSAPPTVASEPRQQAQQPVQLQPQPEGTVSWTASEFIAHHKTAKWYLLLTAAAVITAVLVFLLTRDKITTGMVIFGALAFGIYAARKPRVLRYQVDEQGLTVGEKFYEYSAFKSFSIVQEGAFSNIYLLPLKRFMPALSIYYAPEDESRIVDVLADHLPIEPREADSVDRLLHRIRF